MNTGSSDTRPWPVDEDGRPKLFVGLTAKERERLLSGKSVSIPIDYGSHREPSR